MVGLRHGGVFFAVCGRIGDGDGRLLNGLRSKRDMSSGMARRRLGHAGRRGHRERVGRSKKCRVGNGVACSVASVSITVVRCVVRVGRGLRVWRGPFSSCELAEGVL